MTGFEIGVVGFSRSSIFLAEGVLALLLVPLLGDGGGTSFFTWPLRGTEDGPNLSRPFSRGDAVPFAAGLVGPSLASSTTRSWSLFSPSLCCRGAHARIIKAGRGAWDTNIEYLHGLCPCPAPSSSFSPTYVRAEDRVCCAACTSPVPPEISNFSATKTIDVQRLRSGIFNRVVQRRHYDFYRIPYRRARYDPLSFSAVNPITEIYRIYSSKIFTGCAGFYLLDRFPGRSIGNEGLLATEGMVDGWRVERLNSFLLPSRLNKTTFPSDGWKRHRWNYLSLLARTTSLSLRGERRIIGRIVEPCFFSVVLCTRVPRKISACISKCEST